MTEVDPITIFHRPIRREFTVLGEAVAGRDGRAHRPGGERLLETP